MNDKEQFDALAVLAKFSMERMYDRTKREARMSFAVWAILLAAIVYLHPRPPEQLLIVTLAFIVIVHTWFVIEVWARNLLDKDTAFYYFEHAERLFSADAPEPRPRPDYKIRLSVVGRDWMALVSRDFWWSGMEILMTATLALSAYLLVGTTTITRAT